MLKEMLLVLCFTVSVIPISGCMPPGGAVYKEQLVGGYLVHAADGMSEMAIVYRDEGSTSSLLEVVISPMVYAYGWDDNYIIAKQHPEEDGRTSKIDRETTNWFIIKVESQDVHGPLTEERFNETRVELGVSPELSFAETIKFQRK